MSASQVADNCGLTADSGIESSIASSSSNSVASNSIISTTNGSGASSSKSPLAPNNSDCVTNSNSNTNTNNNTVSAAADSSDNQPSTPQPLSILNIVKVESQQPSQILHQPYSNANENSRQLYATATTASAPSTSNLPYENVYPTTTTQVSTNSIPVQQTHYGNYMSNYDAFYQQHHQHTPNFHTNGILFNTNNSNNHNANTSDYKTNNHVRYHPYMPVETAGDASNDKKVVQNTTSVMSPSLVSSSSPTSTSTHLPYSGNLVAPISPNNLAKRQCKKCGHMSSNEQELQEHVSSIHGASPYGSSSGYSSSPFIKEERTTPNTAQHVGATTTMTVTNAGDILDLDSQKMVYPHNLENIQRVTVVEDPLHSMHNMQQRAIPAWEQQAIDCPNVFYGTINKTNTLPFSNLNIKQEYGLTNVKHEFPDSQQFLENNDGSATNDLVASQSQNTNSQISQANANNLPLASSPAEFPTTTTADGASDSQQSQQQYRNFEPPTSSSTLATNSITTKAATWKSNEARRPKTYNCTACNKWFTSSGHLKRHYNTTLHKNAVKSSNQPDPATQPISTHHHPWRDPNSKNNRRNSQQQQQQQLNQQTIEPPTTNSPDFTNLPSKSGHLSQCSASPSPTSINGYQQQTGSNLSPRLSTVNTTLQNTQVVNGHPNALAGPSAPATTLPTKLSTTTTTTMSSQTRGLLSNTTMLHTINNEIIVEDTINKTVESLATTAVPTVIYPTEHAANIQHQQLEEMRQSIGEQQQEMLPIHSSNKMNNTNRTTSPHFICHNQCLVEQGQMLDNRYTHITPTPPIQQVQGHSQPLPPAHSIMEQQLQPQQQQPRGYNNILHLDINTSTNIQQQFMHTNMDTTVGLHMGHIAMHNNQVALDNHHQLDRDLQQSEQQQHQELLVADQLVGVKLEMGMETEEQVETESEEELQPQQRLPSMPRTLLNNTRLEQLDTMHTTTTITNTMLQRPPQHIIPSHITTPITTAQQLQPQHMQLLQSHATSTIPCFQQLQQQALESVSAALLPLEPTMSYHTIIGNANAAIKCNTANNFHFNNTNGDYLQLTSGNPFDTYATNVGTTHALQQQMISTNDGQILQLIPTNGGQFPLFTFSNHQNYNGNSMNNVYENSSNNSNQNAAYGILADSFAPISSHIARRSPQEADLPPVSTNNEECAVQRAYSPTISSSSSSNCQSTIISNNNDSTNKNINNNQYENNTSKKLNKRTYDESENIVSSTPKLSTVKRRRTNNNNNNNNDGNSVSQLLTSMPNGRIKCLECDKEFTKICYFTQHNKSFHSGEYPYRCQKCGKRFQDEKIYTAHLARHKSQDKPHKCQICPKQFHHKTDLRRHIEAIHTGLKQHVCEVCEKSFCRKDHLRKHLETHARARISSGQKKNFNATATTTNKILKSNIIRSKDISKQNMHPNVMENKEDVVVVNGLQYSVLRNDQQHSNQDDTFLITEMQSQELKVKLEEHSLLLKDDDEEFIEIDPQQEIQQNGGIQLYQQQDQQQQSKLQQDTNQQFRLTEIVLY